MKAKYCDKCKYNNAEWCKISGLDMMIATYIVVCPLLNKNFKQKLDSKRSK